MNTTINVTLDNYAIDGRTLNQWHTWLTTDQETGEDLGHLRCPCSRYGRTSREVAWWAIAHTFATGADDWETGLESDMGFAVNDSDDIRRNIAEYGYDLPTCLVDMIGGLPDTDDDEPYDFTGEND